MKLTLDGYDWTGEKLYVKDEKGREIEVSCPNRPLLLLGTAAALLHAGKKYTEQLHGAVNLIRSATKE